MASPVDDLAREQHRVRQQKWRLANPARSRAIGRAAQARWRARHPEEELAQQRAKRAKTRLRREHAALEVTA